jgi:hypothetical protein
VSPAEMRAALEAGGLSIIEQVDLTAIRLEEDGRRPVIERDDFPRAYTTFRAAWPMDDWSHNLSWRKRSLNFIQIPYADVKLVDALPTPYERATRRTNDKAGRCVDGTD